VPDTDPVSTSAPGSTPDLPPTAVATADFDVAAEAVWAYRLDFANLPDYNPDVSGVSRVTEGDGRDADGGVLGAGARYTFGLADPRTPDTSQPVELWTVRAVKPTLVAAGMDGGSAAYEEFVIEARGDARCSATLTLWVTLPDGLSEDMVAMAAQGSQAQIDKEMRLMKQNLEADAP
jgi:hypothetical protein